MYFGNITEISEVLSLFPKCINAQVKLVDFICMHIVWVVINAYLYRMSFISTHIILLLIRFQLKEAVTK